MKEFPKEILVRAVENALVEAAKKAVGPARELHCVIDRKSGNIRAFANLLVSEEVSSKHEEISVVDAQRIKAGARVGEELEVEVTPAGFDRIASQSAKEALMRHIRGAQGRMGEAGDGGKPQ